MGRVDFWRRHQARRSRRLLAARRFAALRFAANASSFVAASSFLAVAASRFLSPSSSWRWSLVLRGDIRWRRLCGRGRGGRIVGRSPYGRQRQRYAAGIVCTLLNAGSRRGNNRRQRRRPRRPHPLQRNLALRQQRQPMRRRAGLLPELWRQPRRRVGRAGTGGRRRLCLTHKVRPQAE